MRSWLFVVMSLTASAQWLHYPTAGVPRTADGKPNLTAPAPRTPDRKPDLSGMWLHSNPAACPALIRADDGSCQELTSIAREEINIAINLPGGLPYSKWASDLVAQRKANSGREDPHSHCLPPTFPRAWGLPHIQKIIQLPGVITMLNEYNASYRQIFTDGRPFPQDPQPTWNGYSIAKWEGDNLVVQTKGFRDDLWLDMAGDPLTSAATLTERLRRPNFGTLEVEITVDDPKAYTKPWTIKEQMHIVLDTELVDEICLEGERSVQHIPGK